MPLPGFRSDDGAPPRWSVVVDRATLDGAEAAIDAGVDVIEVPAHLLAPLAQLRAELGADDQVMLVTTPSPGSGVQLDDGTTLSVLDVVGRGPQLVGTLTGQLLARAGDDRSPLLLRLRSVDQLRATRRTVATVGRILDERPTSERSGAGS